MKIIAPFVTSDASLVSSTVPYTDPYAAQLTFNIASSSVANPTIVTTATPHGFTVGQLIVVTIAGHTSTPSINSEYLATVTGASTFSIPVNVTVGGAATGTVSSPSYNAAKSYAVGAIVQVDSPSFTFTASGYVMSAVTHGYTQGTIVQVSSTGTLPTGLTAGTRYYIINTTPDTFMLSLTKDSAATPIFTTSAGAGTHTVVVSTHLLYQSVVANNLGNTPQANVAYWLELSSTNRYKCIDLKTASQTFMSDSLTCVLQTDSMIDSVYLGNVEAQSVTITARDPANAYAIVYQNTYSLRKSVATFFNWFFSPIENVSEFADIDLPPYLGMQITIDILNTGNTVKVGTLLVGLSQDFGVTLASPSLSFRDYSLKTANEFGYYLFQERAFSKLGTFQVLVQNADVDSVNKALAKYRATPIVYVGATGYDSAIFFGKFNTFSTAIQYPDYSVCNMEIEGLT